MSTPPKDKPQNMNGQTSTIVRTKDVLKKVPAKKVKKITKLLNELDKGKDGTADVLKMLDMVVSLRRQRFWLLLFLFMLVCFAFVTIASVVGVGYALTEAVKEAIKDTQVNLVDQDTIIGSDTAYPAVDGSRLHTAGGVGGKGGRGEGVKIPPGGSASYKRPGSSVYPTPDSASRTNSAKNTPAYFFSRFMSFDSLMEIKYLFLSACVPDGADEEPACLRMKLTVRPKAP